MYDTSFVQHYTVCRNKFAEHNCAWSFAAAYALLGARPHNTGVVMAFASAQKLIVSYSSARIISFALDHGQPVNQCQSESNWLEPKRPMPWYCQQDGPSFFQTISTTDPLTLFFTHRSYRPNAHVPLFTTDIAEPTGPATNAS